MKEKAKQPLDKAHEKAAKTDWWDDLNDEATASINRGLKDAKAGRVTPTKTQWLSIVNGCPNMI